MGGPAWFHRLPSGRVADILGSWLDRQSRLDAAEAAEHLGGEGLCGPVRPAIVGADWLCALSRGDVAQEAERAAGLCWSLRSAGAGWARMVSVCESRGVEPPALLPLLVPNGLGVGPAMRRVCCRSWWGRRIRRARALELARRELPRVSRYCTPRARDEYMRGLADSAAWAKSAELVRLDSGERWTMSELIARSVADPGVRAAELLTRVKGCGEWAESRGWVGVLVTLTAPGHMHAICGARWTGEDVRQVQAHLSACWARTRSALWRKIRPEDRPVGVRVVEPHRDGCPHWHQVLWMPAEHVDTFAALLRRYYLDQHSPDERGAREHRVKVDMLKGGADGAVGYVIKYVVKHLRASGSSAPVRDLVGDVEIPEADTVATDAVQAWARQWGVRTWQAVGGPPVTIWRGLRRAEGLGEEAGGVCFGPLLAPAIASADSGDWAGFMDQSRDERGGWRRLRALRTQGRWDSSMQKMHEAMPTRYGDRAASRLYQIQSLRVTGTGDRPVIEEDRVKVRSYRWGAVARSADAQLGHVSLTVRGIDGWKADGGLSGVERQRGSGGTAGRDAAG